MADARVQTKYLWWLKRPPIQLRRNYHYCLRFFKKKWAEPNLFLFILCSIHMTNVPSLAQIWL